MIYNWGDFYAIGGDEKVLDLALGHWNAATRFGDDSIVSRVHPRFTAQVHKEYYGLVHPGDAEWHHKGEGNMAFYGFGLANPTISENVRRAKRFASFYNGEDPEASNYDAEYKVLRSPFQTGQGPWLKASAQQAHQYLYGPPVLDGQPRYYGVRASLYPVVKDLEVDWWKDDKRRDEITDQFEKIVLHIGQARPNIFRHRGFSQHNSNRAVCFINGAIGFNPQAVLIGPRSIAEPGCAVIASSCIDLAESVTHVGACRSAFHNRSGHRRCQGSDLYRGSSEAIVGAPTMAGYFNDS